MEAMRWYKNSAAQRRAEARFDLALHYAHPNALLPVCDTVNYGVEQDYAEAVKWWTKGAEQIALAAR